MKKNRKELLKSISCYAVAAAIALGGYSLIFHDDADAKENTPSTVEDNADNVLNHEIDEKGTFKDNDGNECTYYVTYKDGVFSVRNFGGKGNLECEYKIPESDYSVIEVSKLYSLFKENNFILSRYDDLPTKENLTSFSAMGSEIGEESFFIYNGDTYYKNYVPNNEDKDVVRKSYVDQTGVTRYYYELVDYDGTSKRNATDIETIYELVNGEVVRTSIEATYNGDLMYQTIDYEDGATVRKNYSLKQYDNEFDRDTIVETYKNDQYVGKEVSTSRVTSYTDGGYPDTMEDYQYYYNENDELYRIYNDFYVDCFRECLYGRDRTFLEGEVLSDEYTYFYLNNSVNSFDELVSKYGDKFDIPDQNDEYSRTGKYLVK